MKTSSILCFMAATSCLLLVGCSQQSKQEYQAAGQNLTKAAKETGKAVTQDANVAAKAAQNGANAAKATVKNAKTGK